MGIEGEALRELEAGQGDRVIWYPCDCGAEHSSPECPFGMATMAKPARGSGILAREAKRSAARTLELAAKAEAKRRDGKCRWPVKHKCRGGLESAHIVDASLGGEMCPENLITVCAWIHRTGPESIHGKDYRSESLTEFDANGPLAFFAKVWSETRAGEFSWRCVGRERAVGVLEPLNCRCEAAR